MVRSRNYGDSKECSRCHIDKPITEYRKVGAKCPGLLRTWCNQCQLDSARERRHRTPNCNRPGTLRKYGVTLEQFEKMEAEQEGVCYICSLPQKREGRHLCVDHCHGSGTIRRLLCDRCNTTLGKVKDDPDLLRRMAAYLEESHGQ